MPWWINLLLGLGMLAFGSLLKLDDIAGASQWKFAFGQAIQFFSIIFLGLSVVSFLTVFYGKFFGKWTQEAQAPPAPVKNVTPVSFSPPPPPPQKKKYTDRDFMPPALQAEFDAKERKAGRDNIM